MSQDTVSESAGESGWGKGWETEWETEWKPAAEPTPETTVETKFPFFQLPGEIRNNIYKHMVPVGCRINMRTCRIRDDRWLCRGRYWELMYKLFAFLRMSRTCRQMRREVFSIFYTSNQFDLSRNGSRARLWKLQPCTRELISDAYLDVCEYLSSEDQYPQVLSCIGLKNLTLCFNWDLWKAEEHLEPLLNTMLDIETLETFKVIGLWVFNRCPDCDGFESRDKVRWDCHMSHEAFGELEDRCPRCLQPDPKDSWKLEHRKNSLYHKLRAEKSQEMEAKLIEMIQEKKRERTFPFLRLPAEIRNSIYKLTVVSEDKIKLDRGPNPSLAIAKTCRQVYDESIGIFYASNQFDFQDEISRAIILNLPAEQKQLVSRVWLEPDADHGMRDSLVTLLGVKEITISAGRLSPLHWEDLEIWPTWKAVITAALTFESPPIIKVDMGRLELIDVPSESICGPGLAPKFHVKSSEAQILEDWINGKIRASRSGQTSSQIIVHAIDPKEIQKWYSLIWERFQVRNRSMHALV